MSKFILTPEQRAAAELLDRNVLLSAGAGCGKTSTLVERYVNILKDGRADVASIAAITFTEKAANELNVRVHSRLRELYEEARDPQSRRLWRERLLAVESAEIGTIHGFCASILREFPVEARVDPDFHVAEEGEADELLGVAVRDALFDAANAGDAAARRLLERYDFHGLCRMLEHAILERDTVELARDRLAMVSGDAAAAATRLRARAARAVDELAAGIVSSHEFLGSMSFLGNVAGPEDDRIESMRAHVFAAYETNRRRGPQEMLEAVAEAFNRPGGMRGGSAKKWGAPFKEVKSRLTALRKLVERYCRNRQGVDEEDWPARAAEILDFLSLYDKATAAYAALKRKDGILDFDDLLIFTRDLLRGNPHVLSAMARRYRFLLVDEFQDTDHVQSEIVSAIAAKGANLFVVGDPEQSIYGFRGAEVEVFSGLRRAYAESGAGEVRTLSRNLRSLPHIVGFTNLLFSRLLPPSGETLWSIAHSPLDASRAARGRRVEFIVAASEGGIDESRKVEAQAVAGLINEMLASDDKIVSTRDEDGNEVYRAATPGDVAILFRSMSSVGIYERELAGAGIAYYTVAGSTFFRRQEVKDVVNLLRFLADEDDSLGLVAALRGPLFGVSDDLLALLSEEHSLVDYFDGADVPGGKSADLDAFRRAVALVRRLRLIRNRVPVAYLVETIFAGTGYLAALSMLFEGPQKVANAMKIRDAAAAFDARGAPFEDFVARLGELETTEARESQALVEDERGPVVHLMTVHAAKGLEFPIVIVADTGRKLSRGGRRGASGAHMLIDRDFGIALPNPPLEDRPYHKLLGDFTEKREAAEDKRIFYVAATRARDRLVISGAISGTRSSGAMKAAGWAGHVFSALEVSVDSPGDRDFENVTVEYSRPSGYKAAGGASKSFLMYWRDALVSGKPLPVRKHADASAVLPRAAALPPSVSGPTRFTATGIADFSRCPLRYELMHLRGLPADFVLDEARETSVPPGHVVGTVLHEVLERARGERLAAALGRVLEENASYRDRRSPLSAACAPILERLERSGFHRRIAAAGGGRELPFSFLFEGFLIEGRIDRSLGDEVVDFKSDDVRADEAADYGAAYRAQMDVYALAFRRMEGRPPRRATLYFLRPGVEVGWNYGPAGLAAAQRRVRETIARILEGPPYAPRRFEHCRCEYNTLCGLIADRRSTR